MRRRITAIMLAAALVCQMSAPVSAAEGADWQIIDAAPAAEACDAADLGQAGEDAPAGDAFVDEMIIDESDAQARIPLPVEIPDYGMDETQTSAQESDGFVTSVETVDDAQEPECVEDDALTIVDAGLASMAGPAKFRLMAAAQQYEDAYGDQLEGNARGIYDGMCRAYLGTTDIGECTITLPRPLTFLSDNYVPGAWDRENDEAYQEANKAAAAALQAAYNAFLYDFPQAYWLKVPRSTVQISLQKQAGSDAYIGTISKVKMEPVERYAGAASSSEILAFNAAVDAAVAELQSRMSAAGPCSKKESARIIHDYVCEKATYQENEYAHIAAGVFLKGGAVVCEGYAKAFKILCDRFGIDCALIVGMAGEAHMWNYVRMEDGNWYLVDATWDDSLGRTLYFLAGSSTIGAYARPISEERTPYTDFSSSGNGMNFVLPVLNRSAYQHEHVWEFAARKSEATCLDFGEDIYQCTECGASASQLTKGDHRLEFVSNHDATCLADGTRTEVCVFGCGLRGATEPDVGSKLPHSFTSYISNHDATCLADGTKTEVCSYGCGTRGATVADVGSKLPAYAPTLNYKKVTLKVGTWTDVVQASGFAKGDSVQKVVAAKETVATAKLKKGRIIIKAAKKLPGGKKSASTKVTVKLASGEKATITVTVQKDDVKTEKISGIPKKLTVKIGEKYALLPVVTPVTSSQKVTYSTSNKKVATVSSGGVITGKTAGSATVTVKSGSKSVKVNVTVSRPAAKKITGVGKSCTLKKGGTKTLKPKLSPEGSAGTIKYKSSDTRVATVSSKGKITAKKKGTAYITISCGKISVKCKVTVK